MPRYVPPLEPVCPLAPPAPRAAHLKFKQRLIVGNVSRYLAEEEREDGATHKWMVRIQGEILRI